MERTQYKLKDICNIQYGYAFDSKKFSDNPNNIALIRIRDVKTGKSHTYYSGDYDNTYIVNAGDILIGMDGEFNIARWKSIDALLNQRVCKLVAKEGTNEEYLRFAMVKELKVIEDKYMNFMGIFQYWLKGKFGKDIGGSFSTGIAQSESKLYSLASKILEPVERVIKPPVGISEIIILSNRCTG